MAAYVSANHQASSLKGQGLEFVIKLVRDSIATPKPQNADTMVSGVVSFFFFS